MICLIRVDDRLIHGQVQTNWINLSGAKNILVIDDQVRKDSIAQQILKFATPNGMKLKVCNIQEGFAFWEKAKTSSNNILVLCKSITTCEKLSTMGITFDEIMIGPVSYKEGSKEIIQSTYFSDDEIQSAEFLHKKGTTLYFQHTPDQKKEYWSTIKI